MVAAQEPRLDAAGCSFHPVEVRSHRRVAVDRDELSASPEIGDEHPRMTAGAERRVDDRLPRLHVEELADLLREDRDVISRVCPLHVRQHLRRSLRSR
jgi:hypothetical protein